jgi:hypothetical protein
MSAVSLSSEPVGDRLRPLLASAARPSTLMTDHS